MPVDANNIQDWALTMETKTVANAKHVLFLIQIKQNNNSTASGMIDSVRAELGFGDFLDPGSRGFFLN